MGEPKVTVAPPGTYIYEIQILFLNLDLVHQGEIHGQNRAHQNWTVGPGCVQIRMIILRQDEI